MHKFKVGLVTPSVVLAARNPLFVTILISFWIKDAYIFHKKEIIEKSLKKS